MSPTSYQTAPPRGGPARIAGRPRQASEARSRHVESDADYPRHAVQVNIACRGPLTCGTDSARDVSVLYHPPPSHVGECPIQALAEAPAPPGRELLAVSQHPFEPAIPDPPRTGEPNMPPEPAQPKKMPFEKYQAFVPLELPDRTLAGPQAHQGAALVRGRPPRRQPGAHRPDGPGAQAAHVRDARRHGLQGDRGRVPVARARPTSTSCAS